MRTKSIAIISVFFLFIFLVVYGSTNFIQNNCGAQFNDHDDDPMFFWNCVNFFKMNSNNEHSKLPPEPFSLVEGTNISLKGVIMDVRLNPNHNYHLFTNAPSYTFNTGSDGIRLEGINDQDDLHGKVVQLSGIRTQRDLGIQVTNMSILDSLIPTPNSTDNKLYKINLDELFNNYSLYYNQTILLFGNLEERESNLARMGVGCDTANYATSSEFIPDNISSRHLYDGNKKIGIRINSSDNIGKATDPLPEKLTNTKVTVMGKFIPTVVSKGICDHVIHNSGYILTTRADINLYE